MLGNSAFGWLKAISRDSRKSLTEKRGGNNRRAVSFIPRLESLEDRSLPSTLTVLNNADSGPGSLRDTIAVASNGDTIVFDNKLNGQTIKLTSGQLTLDKNLDIEGLGAKNLTVSGNDSSRVFDVAAGVTATIAKLAIAHGMADMGGGIDNAGSLTLMNDILAGNRAAGGLGGGGILNEVTASLTLNGTLLTGNQAIAASATVDVFGGGLLNEGSATIMSSTFSANEALGGGGASFFGGSVGGGIDNFGGATLTVTSSIFASNKALGAPGIFNFGIGGAIENNAGFDVTTPSTATINKSIFLGNVASGGDQVTGNGGAIDNEGTGTTMSLGNSLLLGNQAIGGPGGGEGRGGGLLNVFGSQLTIFGSLLADNQAIGGAGAAALFPTDVDGRGIGGGIDNEFGSTLTVLNSTLIGNQALGGPGSTFGGTLATSNVGDGDGGGIANGDGPGGAINPGFNGGGATLTLEGSRLINNIARGGESKAGRGGTGQGGGIVNMSGSLTVMSSFLVGNRAVGGMGGGGLQSGFGLGGGLADLAGGSVEVLGSTFSGNAAVGAAGPIGGNGGNGMGGAIAVFAGSTAMVSNSTVAFDAAIGGAGGFGGNGGNGLGGGLFDDEGSTLNVTASRITFNLALGGEGEGGGSQGHGIGGGVYSLGAFSRDIATVIKHNHASTSNDDIFP